MHLYTIICCIMSVAVLANSTGVREVITEIYCAVLMFETILTPILIGTC